jgi:hypothetical protein
MRGLNGNEAAQPRVFAHDMVPIAIGAINPRQEGTGAYHNGISNGLEMTAAGAGYSANDIITLTTGAGATEAAQVKILTVDSTGAITSFELSITGTANKPYGEGYVVGDTLNDAGAGVSTFTVRNIDLPNTEERGCCIYAGILIDTGLDLVLESGELYNTTYTARLKGITAGSFLPVLAKRVVAVTETAGVYVSGDLVAIY